LTGLAIRDLILTSVIIEWTGLQKFLNKDWRGLLFSNSTLELKGYLSSFCSLKFSSGTMFSTYSFSFWYLLVVLWLIYFNIQLCLYSNKSRFSLFNFSIRKATLSNCWRSELLLLSMSNYDYSINFKRESFWLLNYEFSREIGSASYAYWTVYDPLSAFIFF
jgi:hypothetical protein